MITHAHWLAPFSVHKMGCSFYQKKEEEHLILYEGFCYSGLIIKMNLYGWPDGISLQSQHLRGLWQEGFKVQRQHGKRSSNIPSKRKNGKRRLKIIAE